MRIIDANLKRKKRALPSLKLGEDLLPGLDLLHGVGHAKETGFGPVDLTILDDAAARGYKIQDNHWLLPLENDIVSLKLTQEATRDQDLDEVAAISSVIEFRRRRVQKL